MHDQILMVLYVHDVAESARFYSALLDGKPSHLSENYAQFELRPGVGLSLWRTGDVVPACEGTGCRTELDFVVEDAQQVERYYQRLSTLDVTILQGPTQLDFGSSLLACDPDGHRLRIIAPPG